MPNLLKEISMNGARLAEDYRHRLGEGLFTTRSKEKFNSDLWLCWEVYYFQFPSLLFLPFTKINPKPLALINVSIEREEKSLAHFCFSRFRDLVLKLRRENETKCEVALVTSSFRHQIPEPWELGIWLSSGRSNRILSDHACRRFLTSQDKIALYPNARARNTTKTKQ